MIGRLGTNLLPKSSGAVKQAFSTSGSGLSSTHHVKKFYTKVEPYPFETPAENDRAANSNLWTVKLDGKTLKTADKHKYFVPNEILARMVAMEFYQQHEYIISATLPLVIEESLNTLVWYHQISCRCLPLENATGKLSSKTMQVHQR
jgi:ATP12 chaperone protein